MMMTKALGGRRRTSVAGVEEEEVQQEMRQIDGQNMTQLQQAACDVDNRIVSTNLSILLLLLPCVLPQQAHFIINLVVTI